MTTVKFPEPEKPDPEPAAPAARPVLLPYTDEEKKVERLWFRAPEGTNDYIRFRAAQAGVKPAEFLYSLLQADEAEQVLSCQPCHGDVYVSRLNSRWARAKADGHISTLERWGLFQVCVDFFKWLLSGVRHMREAA
jgi:hypothetical protein